MTKKNAAFEEQAKKAKAWMESESGKRAVDVLLKNNKALSEELDRAYSVDQEILETAISL